MVMAMDRPSIVLAHFMDSIVVDEHQVTGGDGTTVYVTLVLSCRYCQTAICEVESGDSLRVLFNTALGHDCPEGGKA